MANATDTLEKPAGKRAGKRGKAAAAGMKKGAAKEKGAAKADAETTMTMAQKRKEKARRLNEANTMTFLLDTEVRRYVTAQAKEQGMDVAPYMQKIVEQYVLDTAPADSDMVRRIAAKRSVLDRVVEVAKEVEAAGGFDEHFILTVVRKAATDASFVAQYETAVDAKSADERSLARAKAPINQQMGRLIKAAAGAKSKRDENGKIMRAQVSGEMLSAYTLLEKA